VGRKLEAQPPRLFDESKVLVGKRQDGNPGEIDFLMACEGQQEVERSLEAFDIDDQRRLIGRAIGRRFDERNFLRHDLAICGPAAGDRAAKNSWGAAARSRSVGLRRAAGAAAARASASPKGGGASAATASISLGSPLQWSTRSQPAARAARVRSPI